MTIEAGTKLGRYEIRSKIGEGGMGEVYLAEDTKLDRLAALKILPADVASNPDRMRRFQQEAKAAAALNHPNIAHIYEIGEDAGTNFIAMEYIGGETLSELIHNTKPDLPKLLRHLQHVAEALSKAHAAGIVHRDLKPENIMFSSDWHAKILDFGLAKLLDTGRFFQSSGDSSVATAILPQHSAPGVIMGTAGYMSPEQAQGRTAEIDQRSDIFSFGCILYEAITGRRAFEGTDAIDTLNKIIREPFAPISNFNPDAPADLQRIVRRCLAKDPEERYQSIKDVAIELKEVRRELENRTDMSAPPDVPSQITTPSMPTADGRATTISAEAAPTHSSSAEYLFTNVRRHKTGAAVAGLVFLIVIAGLGYAAYRLLRPARVPFQTIKITKLTNVGNATNAQISPDGQYVAHAVYEAGKYSVRVWHVTTKSSVEIVPPSEELLAVTAFAPDSRYIYYVKRAGPQNALYQIAVLGGPSKKILENVHSGMSFSPDGNRFAFVRQKSEQGETSLVIANADGSGEQTLATGRGAERFGNSGPAWSPDGQIIATAVYTDGTNMTMAAVSVADGTVKPITSERWQRVSRAAWLGDGSGVVFSASKQVKNQIWHVSYPQGAARLITNDENTYGTGSFSITADSSTIATLQYTIVSNVFVAPLGDLARARQITPGVAGRVHTFGMSWTPDGRIVYSAPISGNADIWIMNADGTGNRQLTDDPGYDANPLVSPDGRYVVFESTRAGRRNIWRMDLDGQNVKQLTSGAADAFPDFSADGKWVIYESTVSPELNKVSIEGGDSVRLADKGLLWAAPSPADASIAGVLRDEEKSQYRLAVLPPEGGGPEKTFELPRGTVMDLDWTPDGRAIIYHIDRARSSSLWSQPVEGGEPKPLADFTPEQIFSFALSRDGKSIAFARGTIIRDVILITDTREQ